MSRAVHNYIAPCRWRHVMPLSAMSRNVHFWRWRHRWRCADMSLAMSQLVIVSFDDVAGHIVGDIARRANEAAPCRAIVLNIAARHRRPMVSHRQHRQLVPTVAFFIKNNPKRQLSSCSWLCSAEGPYPQCLGSDDVMSPVIAKNKDQMPSRGL